MTSVRKLPLDPLGGDGDGDGDDQDPCPDVQKSIRGNKRQTGGDQPAAGRTFDPLALDIDNFVECVGQDRAKLLTELLAAERDGRIDAALQRKLALAYQSSLPRRLLLLHRLRLVPFFQGDELQEFAQGLSQQASVDIVEKALERVPEPDVKAFDFELNLCLADEMLELVYGARSSLRSWVERNPFRPILPAELDLLDSLPKRTCVYLLAKVRCTEEEGRITSVDLESIFGTKAVSIEQSNSRILKKMKQISASAPVGQPTLIDQISPNDTTRPTQEKPT